MWPMKFGIRNTFRVDTRNRGHDLSNFDSSSPGFVIEFDPVAGVEPFTRFFDLIPSSIAINRSAIKLTPPACAGMICLGVRMPCFRPVVAILVRSDLTLIFSLLIEEESPSREIDQEVYGNLI